MKSLLPLLLLFAGLLATPAARAVTTCTATADAALPFGTIVSAGAAAPGTLNIRINCSTTAISVGGSAGVRVCVGLGTGSGGATTSPLRTMVNTTTDTMNFQIYNQSNYSQITGLTPNATPAPKEVTLSYTAPLLVGNGTTTTQLFARVPANQMLASGSYSSNFTGANVVLSWSANETLIGTIAPPSTCTNGNAGAFSSSGAFTFIATAQVLPLCGSYLTTDMDFGTVNGSISSNIDRTASLTLTCLKRTAYQISLNNGQNSQGSQRRMAAVVNTSNQYLNYELYRDPARSQRWGNNLTVDTVGGTGTGGAQQLTIYGRVPPVTGLPPAGTYNDRVEVTITY